MPKFVVTRDAWGRLTIVRLRWLCIGGNWVFAFGRSGVHGAGRLIVCQDWHYDSRVDCVCLW